MSERAEILAARFTQVRDEVIAFVEQCSEADWRAITNEERWPVGVVCRHIARGFEVHREFVRRASLGEPLPTGHTWDAVHASNAQQAREWADCTREETLTLLQCQSDEAARVVRQLSDTQLNRTAVFALAGETPVSAEWLVKVMIDHPCGHLQSVRTTVSS